VDVSISTSTTLVTQHELFSTNEQLALAGFLAGYSGLTRDAYTLDLRQYVASSGAALVRRFVSTLSAGTTPSVWSSAPA
jgi:hypothetical protein